MQNPVLIITRRQQLVQLYLRSFDAMKHAMLNILCRSLAVVFVMTTVHATRSRHQDFHQAGHHDATQALHPRQRSAAMRALQREQVDYGSTMMYSVEPFEVPDADVHGPVSAAVESDLLRQSHSPVSGGRGLLHGPRQLRKYSECNNCRLVSCSTTRRFCSGHCRKNGRLFNCSTKNAPPRVCLDPEEPLTVEDIEGTPPGDIPPFYTAVVSVPSPFIGCANIGNRPTGCPEPGTPATLPGGVSATVLATRCRAEYYVPGCFSPLFPFGLCECVYRSSAASSARTTFFGRNGFRSSIVVAPCNTTELPAGAGVGPADGSPSEDDITVVSTDDFTETWFSDFTEDGQSPDYEYSVTATSTRTSVEASLRVFTAMVEEVAEDYVYDVLPDYSDDHYDYDPEGR